jgi:hypothetical protein
MKILALDKLQPGTDVQRDIMPLMPTEAREVWRHLGDGFIREVYFRGDRGGVVLILEADSVEAAASTLAGMPMVKAGFIDFDLVPLGPYRPLEMLFAKEGDA